MSSKTGSNTPRADLVQTVAVVTHGKPETIGEALARFERVAGEAGVELFYSEEEAEKHSREADAADLKKADLVVVLGGDGTMLRALQRTLGTRTPVIGVNFGAVGFLTSMPAEMLEEGLKRVFAGEYEIAELPTLDVEKGGDRHVAVNDVVVASSIIGRMIELGWAVGGEDLGVLPCDGVLCSTPSGSTGYNLSNGGPVLVWGLDAQAVTFIAPHSLHARPLVVPRGRDVEIENRTADVPAAVLVDGRPVGELEANSRVVVRLGEERSLLAHLPEVTFFRKYRDTFAS
jgi:NAD+ kinase